MNAIEMIERERQRQIEVEGWSPAHDDQHIGGELALAACCYASPCRLFMLKPAPSGFTLDDPWPWHRRYDKRYNCGQRGNGNRSEPPAALTYTHEQRLDLLVKAGALIVAEMDRLTRHVCRTSTAQQTVEFTANWKPLEAKLAPELCREFMWMYRENGIEYYKHVVTRRYLRLDSAGQCVIQTADGWKEVAFDQEWKRVSGRS
jgi:hypothetical protein